MTELLVFPLVGTMALWMYFWDDADWTPPPTGQVPVGSLLSLGVGRVVFFLLVFREVVRWTFS